ncbi:MAG: hypothetical protein JNN15_12225 [Blastocatellia bacterium]|nr:hypothetical protein [Blastocatellia bacterium]
MSENLKQEVVQDDEFNIEEVEQVIAPTVIGGDFNANGDLDKNEDSREISKFCGRTRRADEQFD